MELDKNYDFKTSEKELKEFWEKERIYEFNPKSKKRIFSIDTPPPTVSGKMHIGHAFSYSHIDFIARYKRMKGHELFFPFGTDDNGLATERLIEKMKNVKGARMERDEFTKLCLDTLKEIRSDFINDWKKIGFSSDYGVFYSTIDDHCRKISQKSFINLYNDGREYRQEAPTIWCTHCETAIAQVEMKDKELSSTFNDIIFKVDGKDLIIATTRPELLPSCVAIFVHPNDKRYQKLLGKKAKVPLFDLNVPILADKKADPKKGSGVVMCCCFGDLTDVEWYKQHKLPLLISINHDGTMNENAGKYGGLKIKEAREKIIGDLKANKLLTSQKKITHMVNTHERCGIEVEILNTKQWFIKYLDLKDLFLEQGVKLNWHPEYMKVRYDHWINGLQWDWCISRQRFFGVPFPVWYCKKCDEVILADENQLPVDPLRDRPLKKCRCGSNEFIPEKDVLDTWATSSLTPEIAASLFPKQFDKLFPMSLRGNAHDIITFWLFNTLVKSHLHYKKNPWKDVVISGYVLGIDHEKMSKSKGNTIEPQYVMNQYGSDALRFWAAGSKLGEDLAYQEKDLVTGKKLVTKLWNATKFGLMNLKGYKKTKPKNMEIFDKWLLIKLNKLMKESTESFDSYEFSKVRNEVNNFFWHTFCDNYLEITKDRLYNEEKRGKEAKISAQHTLYISLLNILKLMAPIIPFITDKLYIENFSKSEGFKSIHIDSWPEYDEKMQDKEIEEIGDMGIEAISNVRKEKARLNKPLTAPIKELFVDKRLMVLEQDLKAVTKAEKISYGEFKIMF